jgi:hypothetical protein
VATAAVVQHRPAGTTSRTRSPTIGAVEGPVTIGERGCLRRRSRALPPAASWVAPHRFGRLWAAIPGAVSPSERRASHRHPSPIPPGLATGEVQVMLWMPRAPARGHDWPSLAVPARSDTDPAQHWTLRPGCLAAGLLPAAASRHSWAVGSSHPRQASRGEPAVFEHGAAEGRVPRCHRWFQRQRRVRAFRPIATQLPGPRRAHGMAAERADARFGHFGLRQGRRMQRRAGCSPCCSPRGRAVRHFVRPRLHGGVMKRAGRSLESFAALAKAGAAPGQRTGPPGG